MEIWKDVKGYEGKYQVSNMGRVWSAYKQRYLRGKTNKNGYQELTLTALNGKHKSERTHRLVALAFLDKPEGCNVVNHINGCRTDNRVENLEWTTVQGNTKHGYDFGYVKEAQLKATEAAKKVITYTITVYKDNEYIGTFYGKEVAAKALDISAKTIYNCIHENRKTREGYSFEIQKGVRPDANDKLTNKETDI